MMQENLKLLRRDLIQDLDRLLVTRLSHTENIIIEQMPEWEEIECCCIKFSQRELKDLKYVLEKKTDSDSMLRNYFLNKIRMLLE